MRLLVAIALLGCDAGEPPAPPPPPPAPSIPVAFAVVMSGAELSMGNDLYETDENARYSGLLLNIREAWRRRPPSASLPPTSHGMLITYDTDATIRVPMGPVSRLDVSALGEQIDYRGRFGNDVAAGFELAVSELTRVSAARRMVLVLSDGDVDEAARARFEALRPLLMLFEIEVAAVITRDCIMGDERYRYFASLGRYHMTSGADGLASVFNATWNPSETHASR